MKSTLRLAFTLLAFIVCYAHAYSEGTREVMPNNVNGTGLIVSTTASFPLGKVGNYLNCPVQNQIFFNVKDYTNEELYFGFHFIQLGQSVSTTPFTDVYMRIYDPSGTLVSTINLPDAGAGFINDYASAIAGPNIGGATPAGYDPLVFAPTMNGDYYIELYRSSDGGATSIGGGESMMSPFFDLTLAETNNTQYTGRVHCTKWAFTAYDPATFFQSAFISSNATFYAYSTDSVVTKIDLNTGFRPLAFIIAINNYGNQDTGDWLNDRKSVNASSLPSLANGYPVFLNEPDATLYVPGSIPLAPSLVSPVIAGCPPGPYLVRFRAPQNGDYYVLLDLNGIPGFQAGTEDRFFEMINQVQGVITLNWDGLDGLGNPVPTNTSFPITFSFQKRTYQRPIIRCRNEHRRYQCIWYIAHFNAWITSVLGR